MSLVAENIHKVYQNGAKEVRAIGGVSLEIQNGESLAIVGPSGAGKSTLLHLLGGLDTPTSGNVLLDGVDMNKLSDRERAKMRNRRISFVFQFYHLLPEFTALENVMMPALIKGQAVRDRARDVLESVGLADRAGHKPRELSGGESQRAAIARALMNEPEILLCDEPTGNLDSKTSEAIYRLLFELQSRTRMSLILVTHDEGITSRVNRTIHIRDGKIKA